MLCTVVAEGAAADGLLHGAPNHNKRVLPCREARVCGICQHHWHHAKLRLHNAAPFIQQNKDFTSSLRGRVRRWAQRKGGGAGSCGAFPNMRVFPTLIKEGGGSFLITPRNPPPPRCPCAPPTPIHIYRALGKA